MADELVEVARFFNRVEAEVACAILRSGELAAYLKTDNAGGLHPELDFTKGIRLMVLAADEKTAQDLLSAHAEE